MKITDIEAIELRATLKEPIYFGGQPPFTVKSQLILKMYTDEGVTGIGCGAPKQVVEWVKPAIIGEDPLLIERTWDNLRRKIGRRQGTSWPGTRGLCAFDLAMWDILGKVHNTPVYRLLGAHKDKAKIYATMTNLPPQQAAEEALEHKNAGFAGCKLKLGVSENLNTMVPDVNRDIETVRLTREAVGPGFLIMVDANSNYELTDAIKLAQALEEFDITWFEEPIPTRDISHYGELASRTTIPLAAGESEPLLCQQKDLITRGGVRVLQPDVAANTRGLTDGRKVAALAQAFGIPCEPHTWGGAGINLAANLALCCAIENGHFCEYDVSENPLRECLHEPLRPRGDGFIAISDKPGLGVELNDDMIGKYRM